VLGREELKQKKNWERERQKERGRKREREREREKERGRKREGEREREKERERKREGERDLYVMWRGMEIYEKLSKTEKRRWVRERKREA